MQATDPVDLFILPGLAFDKSGGRLGRSGGYYDMFLKKYQELIKKQNWKQPPLVALSYSVQIIENERIPTTPYDVPVDALVSASGFTPISPVAFKLRVKSDFIGWGVYPSAVALIMVRNQHAIGRFIEPSPFGAVLEQ